METTQGEIMNKQKIEENLQKHRLEAIRCNFLANQDLTDDLSDYYNENSYWHKRRAKRWEAERRK